MTAPICVGPQFRVVGNVLDIAQYVGRVCVMNTTVAASNEGTFTAQPALPGTVHIDTTQNWLNNTGFDVMARVEIIPGTVEVTSSQPNLVFVRHRATQAVGTADVPDIVDVFDSEFGGGFDRITDEGTTPSSGVMERHQARMPQMMDEILVPAGDTLQVRFRAAHFAPNPWSDTANNNTATYDVNVTNVTIQIWVAADGI